MRLKHPTYVSLVLEQLRARKDDFADAPMLVKSTGCTYNQVHASLHHLRKARCAEVVVESDGHGWWFALPPENDTRQVVHEEFAYENGPRRIRRKRVPA